MTITNLIVNNVVEMKIEFYKPWKNSADVKFKINKLTDQSAEVFWSMEMNLPFFMFFFKKMMTAYMQTNFLRGLMLLKNLSETGIVNSRTKFNDKSNYNQFYVLGKKIKCNISEMSQSIPNELEHMQKLLSDKKINSPDFWTTLSHDHNIPKRITLFTAGFGYAKDQILCPEGYEILTIPKHLAISVDFYGPYKHIGNGWGMAVAHQRGLKMKMNKKIPPYEIYKIIPGPTVSEKDIFTQIMMPVK